MSLLLLNEDELRQIVTIGEAIKCVKAAFTASAEGRMHVPGHFALKLPEVKGEVQVKGTYLNDSLYYVIKVSSDFQDNQLINLPVRSGFTAVFDAATGFPVAIMVDNGYISLIRAGAAGALAADYLANPHLEYVAVIGSDDQAYMQLKSLLQVRQVKAVSVWADSPISADSYARTMIDDHDVNVKIASSIEAAVRPADLVITTNYSHQTVIKADWLKPGVHITAVGHTSRPKQKLNLDVLTRADVIVTDNYDQCATVGEIQSGLEAGVITKEDVQGELDELIIGQIPGRTQPDQITIADLTGLDTQDTIVATLALEKAFFLDLGQRLANGSTVTTYH